MTAANANTIIKRNVVVMNPAGMADITDIIAADMREFKSSAETLTDLTDLIDLTIAAAADAETAAAVSEGFSGEASTAAADAGAGIAVAKEKYSLKQTAVVINKIKI